MKKRKIKRCPFCGEKATTFHIPENSEEEIDLHVKWRWNYPGFWVIGCQTQMCMGNMGHMTMVFLSEENAIEAWNKRKKK